VHLPAKRRALRGNEIIIEKRQKHEKQSNGAARIKGLCGASREGSFRAFGVFR
jgi:hypothetical protein